MNEDRRLTESLHRRADAFAPEQADMAQIVHRARGIRRRRRTTVTALAAAAVAAVAIPTGLTLGGGPQAGTTIPPAATRTSSPSVSPSPSPSTPATPSVGPSSPSAPSLTLAQVRRGGSVGIGWLEGDTWHNQNGTMTLPSGTYLAITPYRGGFLVTSPQDSGGTLSGAVSKVSWLDNGMNPQWTACGSGRLAVSGDQMIAAYSRLSDCTASATDTLYSGIASGMANSETARPVPAGQLAEPVGQTDQVLVYNLAGLADGAPGGAWYSNLAGQQPPKQVPGLAYATAVNGSRQQVAGASATDQHTGVVVDPVTGKVAWSIQDWAPGQFSADGKYVVAAHSAGGEPDAYAILDASDGSFVQRLDLSKYGMQVVATAWNPDDSLLLLVHQGDQQAIVRLAPGGQVTRVSDVLPADPAHRVVFATQP